MNKIMQKQGGYRGNLIPTIVEYGTTIFRYPRGALRGGAILTDTMPTISASSFEHNNFIMEEKGLNLPIELRGKKFRIRKLTPRECFRLMDVDDADIDKIQAAGISKSSQYKLAGNSIVVSCLYHIFRKMFIDTGNESKQLKLF